MVLLVCKLCGSHELEIYKGYFRCKKCRSLLDFYQVSFGELSVSNIKEINELSNISIMSNKESK